MLQLRQSRDCRRALRWCYVRGATTTLRYVMLCSWLVLALVAAAQGRAVNISNTWVLPEEGFPVFYRYFRDRISWYEADAVCQFHHANLVTVDTTAQYDAVRAYLKELDISSAVWVGLIRSNPDGDFTWTDYRGLSGDGYWSSAPDARSAPLCAASDPAADYRWEARACGGPSVASFICELPVPQWALGNEGCMVRALPALTVLYLPESAAVQLTADCGMAGVKRVQCIGNVKHEDLIRDLSCTEDDESSLSTTMSSTVTTWETAEADQETNDAANEENITTEHEDGIYTLHTITSTPDLFKHIAVTQKKIILNQQPTIHHDNTIVLNKNINLDVAQHNNLQSNDIPKLLNHDDFHSNEQLEKQEDEKHIQHKLLHDELARLGNYENIFSQPTDHFVPPLVMAKAKVNDDMTAISFEEKLAQQHSEYRLTKYEDENNVTSNIKFTTGDIKSTTEVFTALFTTQNPITITTDVAKDKKEMNKHILPKKYNQTSVDVKGKVRGQVPKIVKVIKSTTPSTQTETTKTEIESTTLKSIVYFDSSNEDSSLDLTVIIKEPVSTGKIDNINLNTSNTMNVTNVSNYEESIYKESNSLLTTQVTLKDNEFSTISNIMQNVTLNDEIIKITFIHDGDYAPVNSTVFEVTTRTPIFKDNNENNFHMTSRHASTSISNIDIEPPSNISSIDEYLSTPKFELNDTTHTTDKILASSQVSNNETTESSNTEVTTHVYLTENVHTNENNTNATEVTPQLTVKETINNITESESLDYFEKNFNDTSQDINDFQSPLLSGANEPLHKPNRSRRPQQPNRIKKFNPFRILG